MGRDCKYKILSLQIDYHLNCRNHIEQVVPNLTEPYAKFLTGLANAHEFMHVILRL
jgi:hypothetical protein